MTTTKYRPSRGTLFSQKKVSLEDKIYIEIIEAVANQFNVPVVNMISRRRFRDLSLARNMAFYILHTTFRQNAAQIAPYFNRDRTTVLHGLNTFVNDIETIPFYMERYEMVMNNITLPDNIYALK